MKNKFYPNLFIPGAAKSGTTTLHELLDLHPDISMSSVKEPVFWNNKKLSIFSILLSPFTILIIINNFLTKLT